MGRAIKLVLALGLAGGLMTLSWLVMSQADSRVPVLTEWTETAVREDDLQALPMATSSEAMTAYLPLVHRNFPPPPSQFGVQMHRISDGRGLGYLKETGNHWIRFSAFDWDRIEPQPVSSLDGYNWGAVDETSLRNAAENGMEVIAVVKYTPEWAQKVEGSACGPIREEALDDFADFLTALVRRYGRSPYNVRHWELGNEPDVDPRLVAERNPYGCWGDENDDYYGGGYYAEMLKAAYPAIKAADPRAQVVLGGLLLDCDPTHPPEGKDCKPARFLEGILRNGGGNYFDLVSFHGYPPYNGSLQLDEGHPSWEARGGVVLGKVDFLREVMGHYGVDKPLLHTEGSLICPDGERNVELCDPPGDAFYEAQADYVVWLFVRNWANGVLGTTWYQFEGPGWRYGGMLDENQNPKPAYEAFDFLTDQLGGAWYEGEVAGYPELQGYAFRTREKRIWVLWAPDEQDHTITLPGGVVEVYDKYGEPVAFGDGLTVNSPVYVELSP